MISREGFDAYSALIDEQARQAMALIEDFSARLRWGGTRESRGEARELLRDYAYDVVSSYGDNAAEIAAEYYDELASLAGRSLPDAIMAEQPTRDGVSASVDYSTRHAWDLDAKGNLAAADSLALGASVAQMVGGRVRTAANSTMWSNARRDGERFARVPTSKKPCAFCLMLASRGFVYLSEKSAVMTHYMGKYHDDCRCVAVASFDDEGLEGHQEDADRMYEQWKAASDSLPDKETRAAWNAMSESEKAQWTRHDNPTWNGYANYRTHAILSRTRDMWGLEH